MKNKMEVLIKIGFVVLAISVLPGCTVFNQTIAPEKTQEEQSQSTEQWKKFSDTDLGLSFFYPPSFQISSEILNYNDASKYDPKDFQGKEKRISLQSSEGAITMYGYTKDLRHFYGEKFVGGELSEYCKQNVTVNDKNGDVESCNIHSYNTLKYIFSNEFSAPECSPFVSSQFLFNNINKNSEYTGIVLATNLKDVNHELNKEFFVNPGCNPSKQFDSFIKNRVSELSSEENLSKQDEQMLLIMKGILQSLIVSENAS